MTNINLYKNWCKKCGICIEFCPKKVLQVDNEGYPYLTDTDICNGCGLCELRCPDFAIVVANKREKTKKLTSR